MRILVQWVWSVFIPSTLLTIVFFKQIQSYCSETFLSGVQNISVRGGVIATIWQVPSANVVSAEDWRQGCNVDKITTDCFPKCTLGKARIENRLRTKCKIVDSRSIWNVFGKLQILWINSSEWHLRPTDAPKSEKGPLIILDLLQHSRTSVNVDLLPRSCPVLLWIHPVGQVHLRPDNSRTLPWVSGNCQIWTTRQAE